MGLSNSTHAATTTTTKKQIFILSGQSNMAGRGGVTKHKKWDGIVPSDCQPTPSILRLSSDLVWETAHEPLHADIDAKKVCGVGPGMAFANLVAAAAEVTVGLVPCAVGGTAIKEWARGAHLYENMIRRAKAAVNNEDAELKALIWYQGESDTSSLHDATIYKANMENLITNVRQDLGAPLLPVVQVAIASGTDERYIEKVREAQKGIRMQNVVCVDAKGLQLKEDHLHLTTEAQVKLGHLIAEAYFNHFTNLSSS